MDDLQEKFVEFGEELRLEAAASGDPQRECFFNSYAPVAFEAGACDELSYTPVRVDGAAGYQVDGYAIDTEHVERGELHLAISDFRDEFELESLNQGGVDTLFRRAERFVAKALGPGFIDTLEETSPTFQAAQLIAEYKDSIKLIRLIIFSNARLASRKQGVESTVKDGRTFTYNVWDFTRYVSISASQDGYEPIEIDFSDLAKEPLRCLRASVGEGTYQSYLIAMPGDILARLYQDYGARLLEQNVRTFLQARGNVNKGIIETISSTPKMFFAYNNGITATASELKTKRLRDGGLTVATVKDLQIVNGGQTTGSLLYAKLQKKIDLRDVYVQMKLSVVDPEVFDEAVPKIAQYSNTQNKINPADFFANSPFHKQMEALSRRLWAPQKEGAFAASKWFYERARGQWKDEQAYATTAAKKRFLAEFPKDQQINKTGLAKTQIIFECEPYTASKGLSASFKTFAELIDKKWGAMSEDLPAAYFQEAVAKTILFKWTDRMIAKSEWYLSDKAYKAEIVAYTIAWLVNHLESGAGPRKIDLQQVWKQQDASAELKEALSRIARKVATEIRNTPPHMANVREYCKRQGCWDAVRKLKVNLGGNLDSATIDQDEARQRNRESTAEANLNKEVKLEIRLVNLAPHVPQIRAYAIQNGLLSPKNEAGLAKMESRTLAKFTKQERNALRYLFKMMHERGFKFPDLTNSA